MTKDFDRHENTVGEMGQILFNKDGIVCELITTSQASKLIGYSERHVRRLCDESQLIAIKVNGFWLIEKPSLEFVRERVRALPF